MSRIAVAFAAAVLCACGGGDAAPEQQLAEAREQLEEARSEVQGLEQKVEEKREAVGEAEQSLSEAREELATAEQDLRAARAEIDEQATNVALFRAVQRALLQSEALEDYAIRVEVRDGVVTLHGVVDQSGQAETAREIAQSQTGTAEVRSDIRVREAQSGESAEPERSQRARRSQAG